MVFIRLSIVATVISFLSGLYGVLAAPAPTHELDEKAREILARAGPAAPHWVAYSDKWPGSSSPPSPATIKGFNVL